MDHSHSSSSTESTMPATRPSPPCHSYHVPGSHTSQHGPSIVEPIIPDASPIPQRPPKPPGDLLIFNNGARRVIVLRPKTYEDALIAAKRHFPSYRKSHIRFTTDALPFLEGVSAEISPDAWADASSLLHSVNVVQREPEEPVPETRENSPPPALEVGDSRNPVVKAEPQCDDLCLNFSYNTLKFQHTVHSNLCWGKVFSSFEGRLRVKPATLRFIFGGVQLFPQDSIEISGVCGGDTIDISKEQRCGKFAICVMPASQTQGVRTVSLSLTPEWSFSRTMPVTPSTSMPTGNRAEWSVDIKLDDISPDGVSATKPAYLFWEANTNSPPETPLTFQSTSTSKSIKEQFEPFYPTTADLNPESSVMLHGSRVSGYLDRALTALDLHPEARKSFINDWLPSLQRHQYIALRFVSQASYERSAPLLIVPAPDVVYRVFMIFKGIELDASDSTTYGAWAKAAARADENVQWWRKVVGLEGKVGGVMNDLSLFRVLEYGGMEAKPL